MPNELSPREIITEALNKSCEEVLGELYDPINADHDGTIRDLILFNAMENAMERVQDEFWQSLSKLRFIEKGRKPKLGYLERLKSSIGQVLHKYKSELADSQTPLSVEKGLEEAKSVSYMADLHAANRLDTSTIEQIPNEIVRTLIDEVRSSLSVTRFREILAIAPFPKRNSKDSEKKYLGLDNSDKYFALEETEREQYKEIILAIAQRQIPTLSEDFKVGQGMLNAGKETDAKIARQEILIFEHLLAAISAVEKKLYPGRGK